MTSPEDHPQLEMLNEHLTKLSDLIKPFLPRALGLWNTLKLHFYNRSVRSAMTTDTVTQELRCDTTEGHQPRYCWRGELWKTQAPLSPCRHSLTSHFKLSVVAVSFSMYFSTACTSWLMAKAWDKLGSKEPGNPLLHVIHQKHKKIWASLCENAVTSLGFKEERQKEQKKEEIH